MKFISILLKEGRKEDLKKKYAEKFDEETLDWILNIADLKDFNHKYTDFVLKHVHPDYVDGGVEIGIYLIKSFDKYQSQLEKKDINQYSGFEELDNVLVPIHQKQKDRELEKQVDKIYEDDKFLVIKPKTHQASCKYGSNTKWCTTAQSPDHFERYTSGRQGLYYIINKANSTNKDYSKIAIHFDNLGTERYWDSKDSPMSEREIAIFNYAFPEIVDVIKADYNMNVGSMTDKFLTESFNSVGETSADKRNYLNSTYTLSTLVRGFQNIPDLGFGHTEGVLTISLSSDEDNKLIDEYNIFITYKSKDEKTFTASIGFGSTDEVSSDDFIDLGLEGWGIDTTYYLGKTPAETAEGVRRHIAHRVLDHIVNNQKLIQMVAGTSKVFTPTYGYTFGKNKGWVKKLVDYLDKGKIGTKLDFLMDIGYIEPVIKDGQKGYKKSKGNHFYKPRDLRGQHSSFFAAAKNAGILGYRKVGKDFFLIKGPNFDAFKKGELKAL
jgi:hypothetical protein